MDMNVEIASSGTPTWAQVEGIEWQEVDRALRSIAQRRASLDAEEARWLRDAERLQIWRPLGMVSALDYMERVMGYAPRTAQERLRVARALKELPVLSEELSAGELSFSAVRELTRVANRTTEAAWRDAARGKNLREIEELVAERAPGSLPGDPPEPALRRHVMRFDVSAATFALMRQTRLALEEEHGAQLDDDALIAALCADALERTSEAGATSATSATSGRARYQIALTVCERCDRGWQEGAGVQVPVDAATVERARCDAQHIGSLDGTTPERAHQDIPPSTARFVWRRDGGRCQTPGCRSARAIEIHHIVRRADGGGHEPSNLTLRCSACHTAIHAGALVVTGSAPDRLEIRRPHEPRAHGGATNPRRAAPSTDRLDAAVARAEARDALVGLGWRPAIARDAIDAACADVGVGAPLETLIREALRRCPKPTN